MSGHPVTVAVQRSDGTTEQVRVGTAYKEGDGFRLELGQMTIGGTAESTPVVARPVASPNGKPTVFPNYGRSKGQPIAGASEGDLEFYGNGCRRTLDDPGKARWHEKERELLAVIEAEIAKVRGEGGSAPPPRKKAAAAAPPDDDGPPPITDDDLPF